MEGGGAAAGDSANHTMLLRLLKELNSPLHVQPILFKCSKNSNSKRITQSHLYMYYTYIYRYVPIPDRERDARCHYTLHERDAACSYMLSSLKLHHFYFTKVPCLDCFPGHAW